MTRFRNTPGSPYKALVTDLWPQLGDEDPRQGRWDLAYRDATTRTVAHRPGPGQPLQFVDRGAADPLRAPEMRPLLRVTCLPRQHNRSRPPTLAEVWQTAHGLLFIATLPGPAAVQDSPDGDPFGPPAALRPAARPPVVRPLGAGWVHVPVTVVRVLLDDEGQEPDLWVRCVDHPAARLDRVKLFREYQLHLGATGSDAPRPRYVRLDTVAALSST